jgi:hypothetical protein
LVSCRSGIEGDFQVFGELHSVKRTAGEEALANFQSGDFSPAIIYAENEGFTFLILFNIDFSEFHATFIEEILDAAAIRTPASTVNDDRFQDVLQRIRCGMHTHVTPLRQRSILRRMVKY